MEDNDENLHMKLAISKQVETNIENNLRMEIHTISEVLREYGFSFFDLVDCSPKSYKTKKYCGKAVAYLLENIITFHALRNSKQLPIKVIEKGTKIPRKVLERHRKYIITAAEILNGDFPNLEEYLVDMKEEFRIQG